MPGLVPVKPGHDDGRDVPHHGNNARSRRHRRIWQSDLPTLFSKAWIRSNTKMPAACTSGAGMLRVRAMSQVARLASQGTSSVAAGR